MYTIDNVNAAQGAKKKKNLSRSLLRLAYINTKPLL
jgi:hypothetical protein